MVNTKEFSSRLNKILEYYDISAATFADRIEVGRSSISHILSGRNKPSLDFVMKVVTNFPEVELYWLLNGKGSFPSTPESKSENLPDKNTDKENRSNALAQEESSQTKSKIPFPDMAGRSSKEIQKIVIFYNDGSFDAFEN